MKLKTDPDINNNFEDKDLLQWIIGGLVAIIGSMVYFFKDLLSGIWKKRNDNLERRITNLENGQEFLKSEISKIDSNISIIKHKIDNQDKAEAGAFSLIMDEFKNMNRFKFKESFNNNDDESIEILKEIKNILQNVKK